MSRKPLTDASTRQCVLDAVIDLSRMEQVATRETVGRVTGLKFSIVDDRLKVLTNEGILQRVLKGHYVLANPHPPARPVTVSELADGSVTLEVGDAVLVLTPKEARMIARRLAGDLDDFRAGESIRQHLGIATELSATMEIIRRQMTTMGVHAGAVAA